MTATEKTLKEWLTEQVTTGNLYLSFNDTLFDHFESHGLTMKSDLTSTEDHYKCYRETLAVLIEGEERYFQYDDVVPNNPDRDDRGDCGGWTVPEIDDILEVFPREVVTTITEYVPLT